MKRKSRAPAVNQPSATSSVYLSVLKQSQSRAAALASGTRDFRELYADIHDPTQFKKAHVVNTSDEMMNTFKRKTQELCDETRHQYELKLERQEAQHERQIQNMQRQLREVVGSCVSLAEHEQIVAMTAKEQQRLREELQRRHQLDMREFQEQCEQTRHTREIAAQEQHEKEKFAQLQRIELLELQIRKAAAEKKERELSELRWGEKLEAATGANADVRKRLEDACRIIVALKTRLRHHTRLTRDLELQRKNMMEIRDEVMKSKLEYAALKGDMDSRVASLEKELTHAQSAMADEKLNSSTLQSEIVILREQLQQQQCKTVELVTKAELSDAHHTMECKKLEKEVETLHEALKQEKQSAKHARVRIDTMQQRAVKTQLQQQALVQDLRTRLELLQTSEISQKRQTQRWKQRVEQFKTLAEKLHAQKKQLEEEVHKRDESTEAWAKKLFKR